jgi:methyl-accepting chemotaxis protein
LKFNGKNTKLWERIGFRVLVGVLLPVALGAFALFSATRLQASLLEEKESANRIWASVHASESRAGLNLARVRLLSQNFSDTNSQPQLQNSFREVMLDVEQIKKLTGRMAEKSGVALDPQFAETFARLDSLQKPFNETLAKAADLARKQQAVEFYNLRRSLEAFPIDAETALGRLRATGELYEQATLEKAHSDEAAAGRSLHFYLIALVFLGVASATFVTLSIAGPIRALSERIREIAGDGDLAKRIPEAGGGEISDLIRWINELLTKTESVIGTVANASNVIRSTTERVGQHTNNLIVAASGINKNMMEQSMSLDECTTFIGSIDDLIHNSNESTRQAASLSRVAMDRANQGGHSVHQTVQAMEKIEESSTKVEQLVSSITEIASQTNLLAINAAIEASKAGEHGRGFAVVAEEVRKLAERSRKISGEITAHIGESSARVHAGVALAKGAGHSLDGIIKDVEAVGSLIQRIAASASKQAESSSSILEFMQRVAGNVRTNLQELEQVNRATEHTSQEVARLDALVNQLNSIVNQYELDNRRQLEEAMALQEQKARLEAQHEAQRQHMPASAPIGLAPLPVGADAENFPDEDAEHAPAHHFGESAEDPSALLNAVSAPEEDPLEKLRADAEVTREIIPEATDPLPATLAPPQVAAVAMPAAPPKMNLPPSRPPSGSDGEGSAA